ADRAYLKKTSLYDLAVRCGIEDASGFVERFIYYERTVARKAAVEGMTDGVSKDNKTAEERPTDGALKDAKAAEEEQTGDESAGRASTGRQDGTSGRKAPAAGKKVTSDGR
ncbi:MAG: hypothetical protein LUG56_08520, partial [Lachnospiraceae bacterium]|nr:hypothetical protein [Lachnospiraceae bacterium]